MSKCELFVSLSALVIVLSLHQSAETSYNDSGKLGLDRRQRVQELPRIQKSGHVRKF